MYKSLQSGRAVAAIFVVLHHLGGAIAAKKYFGATVFAAPFSFGNAGVEFFFVLSGFIILTAHRQDIFKPEKLAGYIRKRLTRVYPTYWIVFLSVYILAMSSSTLRQQIPHDYLVVVKSLLLIPQDARVVGGTGAPVIIAAWTLQYEMLFYFFFMAMILSRWLSILLASALLYIYISYSGTSPNSFLISFLSKDFVLLFAMGMIVSEICKRKAIIFYNPKFNAGIGAIMFSLIALDKVFQFELFTEQRTILYGVASSLIILGLVQLEDSGSIVCGTKIMQLLGDSSYALYLTHYPLISILCKLCLLFQLDRLGIFGASLAYLLIFLVCLVIGVAFHLWIEKPVTAYIRNRSSKI